MRVVKIEGRHVIVHPADRWSVEAMRSIEVLGLPVVTSELAARGKLFIVDPAEPPELEVLA